MEQPLQDVIFRAENCALWAAQDTAEPCFVTQGPFQIFSTLDAAGTSPVEGWTEGTALRAQVADVFWQLGPAVACMRINDHTYSCAAPESPGLYLSLVLPPDISPQEIDTLQAVLASVTAYEAQPSSTARVIPEGTLTITQAPTYTNYDKVADGIRKGGAMLSVGLIAAAGAAAKGLQKGADAARAHITPNATPTQVSESTKANLEKWRSTAGKAAEVTERFATGATNVALKVAGGLGKAISSSGVGKGLAGGARSVGVDTSGVKRVGVASVHAAAQVYFALETAGLAVLRSASSAATQVVHHKYGDDAAAATQVGLGGAVNAVDAYRNVRILNPKRLIKATGKQLASDHFKAGERTAAAGSSPNRTVMVNGVAVDDGAGASGGPAKPALTQAGSLPPPPYDAAWMVDNSASAAEDGPGAHGSTPAVHAAAHAMQANQQENEPPVQHPALQQHQPRQQHPAVYYPPVPQY